MNELIITSDGSHSLHSTRFGVSYHSRFGAIQESQHIFMEAALRYKAVMQEELAVLELGFGTGLNAFLTLLEAEKRNLRISYVTLEAFPVALETAQQFNYAEQLGLPEANSRFQELHQLSWDVPHQVNDTFRFLKLNQKFEELDFTNHFDVVYFDAFAPNAQPELWEQPVLERIYRAMRPGAVLTTYCAKGSVKRNFRSLGMEVEALPGPPGKREMTRVHKPQKGD
jgi:tRNA U34 5-methylaminomethyl-2-thiouridine-forming methyltransferase MnmC